MPTFRPDIAAHPLDEFVPGNLLVVGVFVTENFAWAMREVAADVPSRRQERLERQTCDLISRCAGLQGRLPRHPHAVLLPYRLRDVQDPTPLPLLLCDFNDSILFGVLADAVPET